MSYHVVSCHMVSFPLVVSHRLILADFPSDHQSPVLQLQNPSPLPMPLIILILHTLSSFSGFTKTFTFRFTFSFSFDFSPLVTCSDAGHSLHPCISLIVRPLVTPSLIPSSHLSIVLLFSIADPYPYTLSLLLICRASS
jgi:hypothetical protein